jgi:DNA-binding HxlR family transcriptional regulator
MVSVNPTGRRSRRAESFKDLLDWGEGIATNVLVDRLRKLRALKIVRVERQRSDGWRRLYSVTEKGATLQPIPGVFSL